MRKAIAVTALAVALVAVAQSSSSARPTAAAAPAATSSSRVNAEFAALAATLPVCKATDATNCRYGTAATHVEASVQSPTATIYFEMRHGVVTVLQVYPIH